MPLSWGGVITAITVAIVSTIYGAYHISLLSTLSPSFCPSPWTPGIESIHSGHTGDNCANKPHHASWHSWWHPQWSGGIAAEHGQGAGAITKDWNILYHLGGNGPWVEKVIDVVEGGIAPPESCEVVQVHMVRCRHDLEIELLTPFLCEDV